MLDEFRSTRITWDKATSRIYSPVTANASDENGRKLVVQIVNSGQVEDLTGATLHLYWETRDKLHDGLDVFKAVDLKKGEFELSYTTGMLSNQGVLNANLVLIDTVGRVVSERFKITVTEGIDNDAIQSENSFSSLTQALIDVGPRLNDLTAQLQQKVGDGKLASMADLGQDVKEAMTGGSVAVVGTSSVSVESMTKEVADYLYIKAAKNKFNKKTATVNSRMDSLGAVATTTSTTRSDYIPVSPSSGYFFYAFDSPVAQAVSYATQFDSDFNCLGTDALEHRYVQNIMTKPTCAWVVVTIPTETLSTFQMVSYSDSNPGVYNPYYTKTDGIDVLQTNVLVAQNNIDDLKAELGVLKPFETMKMLNYGDSQTGQNKWQPFVISNLGITALNHGLGGYPVAQVDNTNAGFALASDYQLSQLNADLAVADIATIMGGTNDFGYDGTNPTYNTITMGDCSYPYNIKTYKGALSKIVAYINTNYPDVRVILMSPVGGTTKQTGVNLTAPLTNALGYTLETFARATQEVAEYFGVPFIDINGKSGINHLNSASFIVDGTHLNNTTGAKRVAEVFIGGIKQIEPLI